MSAGFKRFYERNKINSFHFIHVVDIRRKALNDQKEMKLLLDMYKGVSKDQRDKVQLMATEKKLRSEIEELRNQMKKIQVPKIRFDYFGVVT